MTIAEGNRITVARRAAGLSCDELEVRSALPLGAVARIEAGARPVSPDERYRLARAIGVPEGRLAR